MSLIRFTIALILSSTTAFAELKPDITEISKAEDGKRLVLELICPAEGGCTLEAQILDVEGEKFRNYLLSNTIGKVPERISKSDCRENLNLLVEDLKDAGFKPVKINLKACDAEKERSL